MTDGWNDATHGAQNIEIFHFYPNQHFQNFREKTKKRKERGRRKAQEGGYRWIVGTLPTVATFALTELFNNRVVISFHFVTSSVICIHFNLCPSAD